MSVNFDRTAGYEQLKKHLAAIKKICIKEDIPYFFAACVKNDDTHSEYKKEMYSGLSSGKELTEDWFPEFVKVTLGMKVDIQRPQIEFDLDDEE